MLTGIIETVEKIKHEVEFNDGSSLKDAVHRQIDATTQNHLLLELLQSQIALVNIRIEILDASNPQMLFRLSADLECIFINEAFLKFFGWLESDIKGFGWDVAICENDKDISIKKWKRARELKARYHNEQSLCDREGTEYRCLVRGYPIIENHVLKGFFGIVDLLDDDAAIHADDLTGRSFWKDRELPKHKK
jgi:PAS domain S-box-containing protein